MATAESLVTDLQNYTEAGAQVLPNAQALECVNLAIRKMYRRHNFRVMQQSTQFSLPGGSVNWMPLPYDFLQEKAVYTLDPSQKDPAAALTPVNRLQKEQWFSSVSPLSNTDQTFPHVMSPSFQSVVTDFRNYYLWANQLVIVPTPSAPITLVVDYMRRVGDLTLGLNPQDQNEFTVLFPDVVRWGALAEAYDWLHEEERAVRANMQFDLKLKDAIDADNATAFAGLPAKRGT